MARLCAFLSLVAFFALAPAHAVRSEPERSDAKATDGIKPPRIDLADAKLQALRLRIGHGVYSLAFSADGKIVATGEDRINLWDAATGKLLPRLVELPGEGYCLSFSA